MRNRVLLINANLMKPPVSPVALDYLGSQLSRAGFEVELLDLNFSEDPERDIRSEVEGQDYLLIGITLRNVDDSYFASQDFCLEKSRGIIGSIKSFSEAPIVVGGIGFSIMPLAAMEYCDVEYGIQGEGERALVDLARCMVGKRDVRGIPGLVYKEKDAYRLNRAEYIDIGNLRLARREFADNRRYFREGAMVGFEASRGCNRGCIYCADPLAKGCKVRLRAPGDIALELKHLYDQGITHFHTCDCEFNLVEEHTRAVCEEIIRLGLGEEIQWYAYCVPVPFTEELAKLMKEAGCAGIDFTVDSGNDEQLKRLGQLHRVEDVRRVARLCHRYGFAFMFDLLLGGPGETRGSMAKTIDLMKELKPTQVGIGLGVRVYAGTIMGELVRKEGIDQGNANLHGVVEGNGAMLRPMYYVAAELGEDTEEYLGQLIGGDSRFLFGKKEDTTQNYNYNDNSVLMRAIKQGCRGAYWDILRRVRESSEWE